MRPQEKNSAKATSSSAVEGHIIVVVEKRRVIVTCIFTDTQNHPQQLFAVKAVVERLTAGNFATLCSRQMSAD